MTELTSMVKGAKRLRGWCGVVMFLWSALALAQQPGSLDSSFSAGKSGGGRISALLADDRGRIWAAGGFSSFNGMPQAGLARLHPDGRLDDDFRSDLPRPVTAMTLGEDGRLFLAHPNTNAYTSGAGLIVAATTGGAVLTSLDGGSWRSRNTGTARNLFDVAFGQGSFVAVGQGGTIVQSGQFLAPEPGLTRPALGSGRFTVTVQTVLGKAYALEYKDSLSEEAWTRLTPITGNQSVITLIDPQPGSSQRFYRVRVE